MDTGTTKIDRWGEVRGHIGERVVERRNKVASESDDLRRWRENRGPAAGPIRVRVGFRVRAMLAGTPCLG